MLSSSFFSNIRSILPGKTNQPPPHQSATPAMGSGASQPVPEHLSRVKEEDDYLVVGATPSERSQIGPSQDSVDFGHQQGAAPPPPSYQDVESTSKSAPPAYVTHPAADIPFSLHPRLQVILSLESDQDSTTIARLAPLDMDKYLYDFSLEEGVCSNEGYGGLDQ